MLAKLVPVWSAELIACVKYAPELINESILGVFVVLFLPKQWSCRNESIVIKKTLISGLQEE